MTVDLDVEYVTQNVPHRETFHQTYEHERKNEAYAGFYFYFHNSMVGGTAKGTVRVQGVGSVDIPATRIVAATAPAPSHAASQAPEEHTKAKVAQGLTGRWSGSFSTQGSSQGRGSFSPGSYGYHVMFVQNGNALAGKATDVGTKSTADDLDKPHATAPLTGRVAGNTVTWTVVEKGDDYGGKGMPYTNTTTVEGTIEEGRIVAKYQDVWVIGGKEPVRYWGDIRLVPIGRDARSTASPGSRGPIDAVLDASLRRSGVDPSSPEAQRAKEFGKLWMNPLSDPKDIDRALNELREDFRRRSSSK